MLSIPHIMIVDDDPFVGKQLERLFIQEGYRVSCTPAAEQALRLLQEEDIDLVVTDIRLPGIDGIELTKRIVARWSDIPVIVMTGYAEIENAVEVLKIGASDYIVKPFSLKAIQESIRVALEKASLFTEIRHLRKEYRANHQFGKILSRTPEMRRVFEIIRMAAPTNGTVVIEGETGTGKELVAKAIHHQSSRRDGKLVTINCGGLPETLLESELFGHERGAFTGADQAKLGKIELAHGGTLFLDEVENMPLSIQAKLLIVLNDQQVQQLGSNRWTRVDMRVICASKVPLKDLVAKGRMRSDFFYRIHVVLLKLPPLRDRIDDVPILVQDFLRHHPDALTKKIAAIAPKALDYLMAYSWPGNIRELHNVLEKAVILSKSRILDVADLDIDVSGSTLLESKAAKAGPGEVSLSDWLREQEKQYLVDKLAKFQGRIDLTAKSSGVDVRTIHRKLQYHGLNKRVFRKNNTKET